MDINIMDRSNSNDQTADINTNELNTATPLSFTSQMFDNETDVKNQNEATGDIDETNLIQDVNKCLKSNLNLDFAEETSDNLCLNNGQNKNREAFEDYFGQETDIDTVDDVQMLSDELKDRVANLDTSKPIEAFDEINEIIEGVSSGTEAVLDNVVDSDSEDEWNYYKGNHTAQSSEKETVIEPTSEKEIEDMMSSQLNPDAAPFVPVSPSVSPVRPPIFDQIIMDDVVIAQSPRKVSGDPLDNFPVPTQNEFEDEISSKPSDLEVDCDMFRPESSQSESSNQEMNLKETRHGDEKLENGLLEAHCPINFGEGSQLNPYIESFKPQDPMAMSFYQNKDGPSENPFDDDLCQIKNNNPFDLNAVQLIPNDSDEDIGLKESYNNEEKYEGLKESEKISNNIEGDLMSPVNEPASPDEHHEGVELLKDMQEATSYLSNISDEVEEKISSSIDNIKEVSDEHKVDVTCEILSSVQQDVHLEELPITKEIQSAQDDIISFINEAVSINNELNETDEQAAPICDTVQESVLSLNMLNASETNGKNVSEDILDLSNNAPLTESTNQFIKDIDISENVSANLQILTTDELLENNIPNNDFDAVPNETVTTEESSRKIENPLHGDEKLTYEFILSQSEITETPPTTHITESIVVSSGDDQESHDKFEKVDDQVYTEKIFESFKPHDLIDTEACELKLSEPFHDQTIAEATQKVTEEVTSLLQEACQLPTETSEDVCKTEASKEYLDNYVCKYPTENKEVEQEILIENVNILESVSTKESANKSDNSNEQILGNDVVERAIEPITESAVEIIKEVSETVSSDQKLEESKISEDLKTNIIETLEVTAPPLTKDSSVKQSDKPALKKNNITTINKKPATKAPAAASKTTSLSAKPSTNVKKTASNITSKTVNITKTSIDKIGTKPSNITAKPAVGVKLSSARSPAVLRVPNITKSTTSASPRSTVSKTSISPRVPSSLKASPITSNLAKPSAEKKPLVKTSLTNGVSEKPAPKKPTVSLSTSKPLLKTATTTKPPPRPSTAPTTKTTVPPRVPLTKPRVSSTADKVTKNTTNLAAKTSTKSTSVSATKTSSLSSSMLRKTEAKTSSGTRPVVKTSTVQKVKSATAEKPTARTVTKSSATKTAIIRPTKASVIQNGDTKIIVKEELTFTKEIEPMESVIQQDTTLILIDSSTD